MIYRVDLSKKVWRYLYHDIYDRIYDIAMENNGTGADVVNRILRLVSGDNTLYLLVELRDNSIISHALINILGNIAFIEQVDAERKKDNTFAKDVEVYICTQIKKDHPEITKMMLNTKREEYRALERKYGFYTVNILMGKDIKPVESIEEESI